MHVSSNATALSRRSVMRGMAALVGASMPVAAVAAPLIAGDDSELLNHCSEWHDRSRLINRTVKKLERLSEGKIRFRAGIVQPPNNGESSGPLWARHKKTFEQENGKNWRLFMRIIRGRAETLQGMAAQFEVMERSGYLVSSYHPGVNAAIIKGMSNLRRLVAAQSMGV